MRGRRGRPGLMGVAARTAVVAGTATAVSGKMQQGQQAKAQQAEAQQAEAQQAEAQQAEAQQGAEAEAHRQQQEASAQAAATQAAAPAALGTDDMLAALERLAALHAQGILTDDELAQQKARILG